MNNSYTRANTVVLGHDELAARRRGSNVTLVRTPLELIQLLERTPIETVVLAGEFARRGDLVEFLHDEHPDVSVTFEILERERPVVFLPQLAFA